MDKVDELLLDNFSTSLDHAGVKGMKWGQRKARIQAKRTGRQQKVIDRHRRVAAGGGSARDKATVALGTSGHRLIKGKGLQGGAQLTLKAAEAQKQKVISGEKKVQDILLRKVYGMNVRDLNYSMITTAKVTPKK